jgi:hypothetical protein
MCVCVCSECEGAREIDREREGEGENKKDNENDALYTKKDWQGSCQSLKPNVCNSNAAIRSLQLPQPLQGHSLEESLQPRKNEQACL